MNKSVVVCFLFLLYGCCLKASVSDYINPLSWFWSNEEKKCMTAFIAQNKTLVGSFAASLGMSGIFDLTEKDQKDLIKYNNEILKTIGHTIAYATFSLIRAFNSEKDDEDIIENINCYKKVGLATSGSLLVVLAIRYYFFRNEWMKHHVNS